MEGAFVLLVLAGIGAVFAAAAASQGRARKTRQALLEAVAASYPDAHTYPARAFSEPTLTMPLEGGMAKAEFYSTGGKNPTHYSQVTVQLPAANLPRLALRAPEGPLRGLGRALGFQDVEVGDPDFDPIFVVKGEPEPRVREVLDDRARAAALSLYRLYPGHDIDVAGQGTGQVRIRKKGWYEDAARWCAYLDLCLELATALRAATDRWWMAAAIRRGLEPDGRDHHGGLRLRGVIDSVSLTARVHWSGGWVTTEVHADVPCPFTAIHEARSPRRDRALRTGNAVLDMLVRIDAEDERAALAILGAEGLVDALLPVVHGHPGSTMGPEGITLNTVGWLEEEPLVQAIDAVSDLASRVRRGPR